MAIIVLSDMASFDADFPEFIIEYRKEISMRVPILYDYDISGIYS